MVFSGFSESALFLSGMILWCQTGKKVGNHATECGIMLHIRVGKI